MVYFKESDVKGMIMSWFQFHKIINYEFNEKKH